MNEVKKFLSALRNLKEDFGMNGGGFIEYATRMGALIELADEERRPVADKALSLWLESGTPHCRGWLREQSADVILQSVGPCVEKIKCGAIIGDFESVKEALKTHSPDWVQITKGGILLEIDGFNIPRFRGGYHTLTLSEQVLPSYSSVVDAVVKTHYPLREECADAAQWFYQVKDASMPGGSRWLKNNPADWIITCARKRLDARNAKRQPVADSAMILWTVFGARVGSLCETCPVDLLSKFDNERAFHADKARDVYFKRVGVPLYIQDQMMVMGWDWIESEWLSLQGPKRCGTRITVLRLGTLQRSSEFGVAFYKGGVAFHEERFSGYITPGGCGCYERNTQITDYDEYRVIGDACVSVEAIYESR